MAKAPAFQFYTGDWLKDPKLSMCSPATRGIWVDLLCAMHEQDRSGTITGTTTQLCRLCRCSDSEMHHAIEELKATKTATVTERNGIVTVINRRMLNEAKERDKTRQRVQKHRGNGAVTDLKRESNSASSSSSSSSYSFSLHKKEKEKKSSPSDIDPPSLVFNAWKSTLDHPKAVLDKKRRARIAARLSEGFSADDLVKAIHGVTQSPWHLGQDPANSTRYDGIETIFRDAAQVEKFIALAGTAKVIPKGCDVCLNSEYRERMSLQPGEIFDEDRRVVTRCECVKGSALKKNSEKDTWQDPIPKNRSTGQETPANGILHLGKNPF